MVEVLALIPARGGSKGIPRKNIKRLGDHPLIAYSIAAGIHSDLVKRTVVSTDDPEIAEIARSYGAETPFIRPAELAADNTRDLPVFQHALSWLAEQESYRPDILVQLRPTSPFRPPELVDEAVQILLDHPEADSVRGVVPSKQNPYKMWRIQPEGQMVPLLETELKEHYNMPRQKLPMTYWQTGHIDAIRTTTVLNGSMSGENIFPCRIDPQFSVDLDNLLDWDQAENSLAALGKGIVLPSGSPLRIPEGISLIVLDFDGVLTDDRVYVDQSGVESVAAHRGDGMGIALAKKAGLEVVILSTEKNPVVQARAEKLRIPVFQGIDQKGEQLSLILKEKELAPEKAAYIGNDLNDLPCFPLVGCSVAVADAHPQVLRAADLILSRKGGHGAVREFIELLLGI